MPVQTSTTTSQSPGFRSTEHAKREKGILEDLRRSSAFKSGTLVRECRFYIGAEELSTAKESEASPAGRRAGSTRPDTGVARRRTIQDTAKESEASPAGRRAGSTRPGTGVARRRTIQECKRHRGREASPESQERE